jgi:hypothetical protein
MGKRKSLKDADNDVSMGDDGSGSESVSFLFSIFFPYFGRKYFAQGQC